MFTVYIPSSDLITPYSCFYGLNYLPKEEFVLCTSFKHYVTDKVIFLNFNEFILNFIKNNKLSTIGFIFSDDDPAWEKKVSQARFIKNVSFIYVITKNKELVKKEFKLVRYILPFAIKVDKVEDKSSLLVSESFFCKEISKIEISSFKSIFLLLNSENITTNLIKKLRKYKNIYLLYNLSSTQYKFLLSSCYYFKDDNLPLIGTNCQYNIQNLFIDIDHTTAQKNIVKDITTEFIQTKRTVNVVCFQPSYLFKDLVDKFVSFGCVFSDVPLKEYDSYLWIRPQEIWHGIYIQNNIKHQDIKKSYVDFFKRHDVPNIESILSKSVAIHHGTCFLPLYQFCPFLLAEYLGKIKKVFGVCDFDSCYGPSVSDANKDNFECLPIGFDEEIFSEKFISKKSNEIFNIGIVGRVYGTLNQSQVEKSILAEPYGYRKGVDFVISLAYRLKNLGLNFKFTILGVNWEYAVNELLNIGVKVDYVSRDKDIQYKDYPKVYATFDMLLVSSRCEGGPVPLMEALSLGIPVVSSNVGVAKFFSHYINNKFLKIYDYNCKWSIYDIKQAVKNIYEVYNTYYSYDEKLEVRKIMRNYTTKNWVESIVKSVNS